MQHVDVNNYLTDLENVQQILFILRRKMLLTYCSTITPQRIFVGALNWNKCGVLVKTYVYWKKNPSDRYYEMQEKQCIS
jgi:hypothetical protein